MPETKPVDPVDLLPLRPVIFAVLLALNEAPQHGYAIMKNVNDRMRRRVIVGPGTLYRTLKEMKESGLVEPAAAPPPETDERRQYYRLTARGTVVARLEAARLAELVADARAGQLLPEIEAPR